MPQTSSPLLRMSPELNQDESLKSLRITVARSKDTQPTLHVEEKDELIDPEHPVRSNIWTSNTSTRGQKLRGWRGGLLIAIAADFVVILIILALLLKMKTSAKRDGGEAILVEGSCSKTKSYSVWSHLIINLLSTTLLSTSSYAMQLLSSPTKAEVKKAHQKSTFVDIGRFSLRNARLINPRRVIMYSALALTSVPIHLLANATVYASKGTNSYMVFIVSNDFRQVMQPSDEDLGIQISMALGRSDNPNGTISRYMEQASRFINMSASMTRLENDECIKTYSDPFVSGNRHVIAVSKYDHRTNYNDTGFWPFFWSDIPYFGGASVRTIEQELVQKNYSSGKLDITTWDLRDPSTWICQYITGSHGCGIIPDMCDVQKVLTFPAGFVVCDNTNEPYPVDYCLSEVVEETCKIHGNITISMVLLVCAILKSATLLIVFWIVPRDVLTTIGDAIAFFLENPEPRTAECSLLNREVAREWVDPHERRTQHLRGLFAPNQWMEARSQRFWGREVPGLPLTCSVVLQIGGIGFGTWLMNTAAGQINDQGFSKWDRYKSSGFGTASLVFVFRMRGFRQTSGLLSKLVLVNLPQLYLSFYYFVNNTCWTGMLSAREWGLFGREHRALRVSQPMGAQKSTYFLTMPYRFAIPIQLLSVLLHWLTSQSLFFLRIDIRSAEPFAPPAASVVNTIGYSPVAVTCLLVFISVTGVVLLGTVLIAKTKTPMYGANGCSLAISAACHGPPEDTQSWLKPLRWGVIDSMEHNDFLHCALTSQETGFWDRVQLVKDPYHYSVSKSVAKFA